MFAGMVGVLLTLILILGLVSSVYATAPRRSGSRKKCIAVLARGQADGDYGLLHARQKALSELPWTQGWDHLIFHEGNISQKECGISARYVDVSQTFRKFQSDMPTSNLCSETCLKKFPMGYRAMCLFWFDDFLDYVQDYDEILRIDDDCTLDRGQPEPELPEGVVFASSATQGCDVPEFTEGMPELFQKIDPLADYSKCKHPYTNVMWLDVKWALRTRSMKSSVLESRCIQINRWGDLPLWGFYLKLLGVPIHPLHLSYFHGSHKYHIKT